MAYRFMGDPKWDEPSSIYGPREPLPATIVLSSDESDDNRMVVPVCEAPPDPPPPQIQNDIIEPPSMLSRNIQRSMWDYLGYASDSDDASGDGAGSTANSRKEMRMLRHAQQNKNEGTTSVRNRTPSGSMNNSSCASNDPFGKRRV